MLMRLPLIVIDVSAGGLSGPFFFFGSWPEAMNKRQSEAGR